MTWPAELVEHVAEALYGDGWEAATYSLRLHHLEAAETALDSLATAPGVTRKFRMDRPHINFGPGQPVLDAATGEPIDIEAMPTVAYVIHLESPHA